MISPSDAVDAHELEGFIKIGDVSMEDLTVQALDCGFPSLNKQYVFKQDCGGLVVVGARVGNGKSAMVMQIAKHVASQGKEVVVYSSEMGVKALTRRVVAGIAGVDTHAIMDGTVSRGVLLAAHQELNKLPLTITASGCRNINLLCNTARAMHRRKPLSLIVVDYIQNVTSRGSYNRAQEIGKVSLMLRELAVELNCTVLAAAQLNRNSINREHKADFMPDLGDLKDCGEIEQDADAIVLISLNKRDEACIKLAKARDGRIGEFKFKWFGDQSRFEDPEEESI